MRILMMGTGEFALPTFRALLGSEHEVVGLVTQPDRIGRGHHHHPHPMKELALAHSVEIFQPEKVNAASSIARLKTIPADLYVVAAYGQILSAELLSIPRLGAINVHASLLPKYRGAAPVQYAVLNGEAETGVTIFQIEPKLDAGPVLGMVKTPIGAKETSGELEARLAELATELVIDVVHQIETGRTHPQPQDRSLVSKAPKITKTAGEIDWSNTSAQVGQHIRAMQPWPMPYTFLHVPSGGPHRLLVLDVDAVSETELEAEHRQAAAGEVLSTEGRLRIRTGDGAVDVLRLQPAGKRAMATDEFLRGHHVPAGSRLAGEREETTK